MADVFVSYSRADGAFVRELHAFLTDRGKDVWIDWEDIPPAAEWEEDIEDNIDAAESFVFVVSRNSLASRYSLDELRHAGERGKRIVPIACDGADPAEAPEGLRQLNWIWCRPDDDRSAAFAKVLEALDTDLAWAEVHTRLLVRAVEWDARRDSSLLLRGRDLEDALQQVTANAGKEPVPTELQREYLFASRRASARRQRVILGSVSLALVVAVSLAIVALVQRNLADERARVARSQAFAAQAVAALDSAPADALAGAVDAMETHRTPEARVALRRAILANPVAYAIGSGANARTGARLDAVAFSGDGRLLLGLGPDGVLHVWRSATGREVAATRATMFAQRGRLLVAARRREARVLDLRTGAALHTLRVPRGRVIGVGFQSGVARAAVSVRRRVVLKRIPARRAVSLALRPAGGTRALFSDDGDRVVTFAGGTRARVWDAGSGRLLATHPAADVAAISPDGSSVVTLDAAGEATLRHVGARTPTADLGPASGVVFSSDAELVLAVGENGGAGVWRSSSGRLIAAFPGFGSLRGGLEGRAVFSEFSPAAAFSRDGRLVALGSSDGNVRIWDVAARKQVGAVGAGWANAVAFAPRGRMLATMAWDGEVVVARSPTSVPLRTGFRPASCVPHFDPLLSPDGRHVLARARAGAGVWTVGGRRVATLAPPAQPAANARNVGSAAFSGDGRTVAAASSPSGCFQYARETHGAAVWRLGRRAPLREVRSHGSVTLDMNGRLVAVGGGVWPTARGERLHGLGEVLALGPDGTVALALRGGRLEVVAAASGETLAALRDAEPLVRDARDFILPDASFSPDGQRLLTSWGPNARLWDATTGEPIALLGRDGEDTDAFGFGDEGRLALATFPDRAAVFSAADGTLLSSVTGSFDGGVISSNGALAAVPQVDGGIHIVDLATDARATVQTDTAARLTSLSFGPTADLIVARDEVGDVHVVRCEICAPEDELMTLARARLAVLARIEAKPPPVAATG